MSVRRDYRIHLSDVIDIRSGLERFRDELLPTAAFINTVYLFYVAIAILLPWAGLLLLLPLAMVTTWHVNSRKNTYPNRLPIYVRNWVAYTPKLKSMKKKADGVTFVGNIYQPRTSDMDDSGDGKAVGMGIGEEVWENVDQSCIHRLVNTGTGGGKTTSIISSLVSMLCSWGHVSMSDGKGENTVARTLWKMLGGWGLQDDFRSINYMTSNAPTESGYLRSHQINLFSGNDAAALVQIINGMIGSDSGQNKVFQERATILGDIAVRLVYDRASSDPTYVKTLEAMSEFLNAAALIKVLNSPASVKDSSIISRIKTYLQSLQVADDVTVEDWYGPEMKEARRQHLFCQMYFTKSLLTLTHTYGYIFNVKYGDFTWRDATNNKRYVYQLMPAIDKSVAERRFLAEMVSQLRLSAVKRFLGARIQGDRFDAGDLGHNRSISVIISDEHLELMTEDDPTLIAQLRSMRFAMQMFLQSTQYGEALDHKTMVGTQAIVGVLQVGRTTDQSSIKRIKEIAGERLVAVSSEIQSTWAGLSKKYYRGSSVRLEKRPIIEDKYISSQSYGEVFMSYVGEKDPITGGTLTIPVRLFYLGNEAMKKMSEVDEVVLAHLVKPVDGNVPSSIIEPAKGVKAILKPEEQLKDAPEEKEEPKVTILTREGFLKDVPKSMLEADSDERKRIFQKNVGQYLFDKKDAPKEFRLVIADEILASDDWEDEI